MFHVNYKDGRLRSVPKAYITILLYIYNSSYTGYHADKILWLTSTRLRSAPCAE